MLPASENDIILHTIVRFDTIAGVTNRQADRNAITNRVRSIPTRCTSKRNHSSAGIVITHAAKLVTIGHRKPPELTTYRVRESVTASHYFLGGMIRILQEFNE